MPSGTEIMKTICKQINGPNRITLPTDNEANNEPGLDISAYLDKAKVRLSNSSSPGIDRVLPRTFKDQWNKDIAAKLAFSYYNGYRPSDLKEIRIPKIKGGFRTISIPTCRDRVVCYTLLAKNEMNLEKDFHPFSFGARSGRSIHHAIEAASILYRKYGLALSVDIQSFFDDINHDILMSKVGNRLKGSTEEIKLVSRFIRLGRRKGLPQGLPISPCLANIYLDEIDEFLELQGISFVRYLDDILIFPKSLAAGEEIKEALTGRLSKRLRLRVHPDKTKLYDHKDLPFLGFIVCFDGRILSDLHALRSNLNCFRTEIGALFYDFKSYDLEKQKEIKKNWLQQWQWHSYADNFQEVKFELDSFIGSYRLERRLGDWLKIMSKASRGNWRIDDLYQFFETATECRDLSDPHDFLYEETEKKVKKRKFNIQKNIILLLEKQTSSLKTAREMNRKDNLSLL